MRYLLLIALLTGCGWFTSQSLPAMATALEFVAQIVERETGRSLDELPAECDHEFHPATPTKNARVLILCEIELPKE
jgi:hypothetical protein